MLGQALLVRNEHVRAHSGDKVKSTVHHRKANQTKGNADKCVDGDGLVVKECAHCYQRDSHKGSWHRVGKTHLPSCLVGENHTHLQRNHHQTEHDGSSVYMAVLLHKVATAVYAEV